MSSQITYKTAPQKPAARLQGGSRTRLLVISWQQRIPRRTSQGDTIVLAVSLCLAQTQEPHPACTFSWKDSSVCLLEFQQKQTTSVSGGFRFLDSTSPAGLTQAQSIHCKVWFSCSNRKQDHVFKILYNQNLILTTKVIMMATTRILARNHGRAQHCGRGKQSVCWAARILCALCIHPPLTPRLQAKKIEGWV